MRKRRKSRWRHRGSRGRHLCVLHVWSAQPQTRARRRLTTAEHAVVALYPQPTDQRSFSAEMEQATMTTAETGTDAQIPAP